MNIHLYLFYDSNMRVRDTNKEQLVIQKAIERIVKEGLEGFSMNKLAKDCNISVATLYIYYKDRDDLIMKIAGQEGKKMGDAMIKNFDPEMPFEDGLRVQWINRYQYMIDYPEVAQFFDQLQNSAYGEGFLASFMTNFKASIWRFMQNVFDRGEIERMPIEVFWVVAYAPLYQLIRFHNQGHSIGGRPFTMNDKDLWDTFKLVVKALKK